MKRFLGTLLKLIGGLTLALALAGFAGMYLAGEWMQVHDEPRQADYILPLAGDNHRYLHAADLYKRGLAPAILISIPASSPPSPLHGIYRELGYPDFGDTLSFAKAFFGVLGVPERALVPFGDGHLSTVEEAEALRDFLGPGPHTILAVTSPYHARRAKLVLTRTLPDCEIVMTTTPYEHFEKRWWADYHTAPKVVLEAAKCVYYLLGGVFRSGDVG